MESRLDLLIRQAAEALDGATGGAPLCAIARDGRSFPAAKYHEGSWAALTEVRRSAGGIRVVDVLERWVAQRARLVAQGASEDWLAYASGGIDAVTSYLES